MPVSLQIESHQRELKSHAEDMLKFARRARTAVGLRGTVSIQIGSSERMRALNRCFRKKDKPTDVLSFPSPTEVAMQHAGDIAISADIAAANARSLGHSIEEEIKVLVLHGMLHLAGHDHETDKGEMAQRERRLRAQLRLPDSLIARAASPRRSPAKPPARRKTARINVRQGSAKSQRRARLSQKHI